MLARVQTSFTLVKNIDEEVIFRKHYQIHSYQSSMIFERNKNHNYSLEVGNCHSVPFPTLADPERTRGSGPKLGKVMPQLKNVGT